MWYDEFATTLDRVDPDALVVNAGAAQFTEGEPITMDIEDVRATREATIVAVHTEAINHCLLTREELADATGDVLIPDDGERIELQAGAQPGR